jgi:hypothetical protein
MEVMSRCKGDLVRIPQKTLLFDENLKKAFYTPDIKYGIIVEQTQDSYGPMYEICIEGEYWFVGGADIYSLGV